MIFQCRSRDRKGKKNLYQTSHVTGTGEMVALRSVSPETEEAKKKELEASSELEATSPAPVPVPQIEGEDSSLCVVDVWGIQTAVELVTSDIGTKDH